MPIKRLPGVYYDENVTYELTGEGSKIPIFIGTTGHTDTYSFTSYSDENKTTTWGRGTVAKTGNVNELIQISGDVLVLNCGSASTVI